MTEPPKKPARKRFQFSLRTLLIVVLSFAGSWFLTIKWGANQIAREHADEWLNPANYTKNTTLTQLGDGKLRIDHLSRIIIVDGNGSHSEPKDYAALTKIITVRARFPFILQYWEENSYRNKLSGSENEKTFIWFFGAKYQWSQSAEPTELE